MSLINRVISAYHRGGIRYIFSRIDHKLRWYIWDKYTQFRPISRKGIQLDISDLWPKRPYFDGEVMESEEAEMFTNHYQGGSVIELGAGIGFLSVYINKKLHPGNRQISVEANPELIQRLKRNRELNNADFEIVPKAYSPSGTGTTSFYITKSFVTGGIDESHVDREWNTGAENEVTVNTVNVSQICQEYDIDEATLVCDIEGAETGLIQEELEILESRFNRLIIEWHAYPNQEKKVYTAKRKLESGVFTEIDNHGSFREDSTVIGVYAQ